MTGEDLKQIAEDLSVLQNIIKGQILSVEIQYPSGAVSIALMEGDDEELQVQDLY